MKSIRWLFMALPLSALLGGCGGSGGGSAGSVAGTPASSAAPTAAITKSNQETVARATFTGTQVFSDTQGPLASDQRTLAAGPARSTSNLVVASARRGLALAQRQRLAGSMRPFGLTSTTTPCAVSGTMAVGFDDRDNNGEISAGDALVITWVQCRDTATTLVNGTLSYSITRATHTSTQLSFESTVAFQQLVVVNGPTTSSINGSITVAITETPRVMDRIVITIGPDGLTSSVSGPHSDTVVFEAGSTIDVTELLGALGTTVETICIVDGSISSSAIGGRVAVRTLQPVRHRASDRYPHAGQVRVVGVNGGQLQVTILDATQVRIEIDADGDGRFEESTVVAWNTLVP